MLYRLLYLAGTQQRTQTVAGSRAVVLQNIVRIEKLGHVVLTITPLGRSKFGP